LMIRLGHDHPIVEAHGAFRDAYSARHDVLLNLYKEPLTDADRAAIKTTNDAQAKAFYEFLGECRKWAADD
jgi:hypothetical protein